MKKTWILSLIIVTALLVSSILPVMAVPALASTTGVVIEHFSDEVASSKAFSTSSFGFQLNGNNLSVSNAEGITGLGWTGTATDNYFVDNYSALLTSEGVVGSIQINPGAVFQVHSLYIFPGENGDFVSNNGTVKIRGSLKGSVKFTEIVESTEVELYSSNNNGWTYVDLSSYSATLIDKLEFELTGGLRYLGIDAFKHESTLAPKVSDANISISGATGFGGTYRIGDTVTATWNNTLTGDNNLDVSSVKIDFSQFGGESAVAAINTSGTWTANYTVVPGAIDAVDRNVSVSVTNTSDITTTTADTANAKVDNVAPNVTDGNISICGGTGTGGAFKIGDTVTATWNNTSSGENNSDTINSVTSDFSQFGGGSAVVATSSAGTWTATYTIVSGAIDAMSRNVSVTVTDNGGNSITVPDTTDATVDNIAPTVTDDNIAISGATGTDGTYRIGDTVTAVWNNTADGDNNSDIESVTVDFRQFGGSAAVAATNAAGTWTAEYIITSGSISATNRNVSITVTDNIGNSTTTSDTANATVDNSAPIVSSVGVPFNALYKTGDNLDFTVNFNQNVTVNTTGGTPRLFITVGVSMKYAYYLSGSGTTALKFRYTAEPGMMDPDGIAVGMLSLNGGTIKDTSGNDANATLNSVGNTAGVLVDAVAPIISSVTVPANGTYTEGGQLIYTVNFSENVTVTGTPYLTLTIGSSSVHADYRSGSGTSALKFGYTILPGDKDIDGVALSSNVSLGIGTIKDAAGNNSALTFTGSTAANVLVKLTQTITFSNPGAQNFGTSPKITATSSSELPVTFTSVTTGVCTITSDGILTFVTAGTATIIADQPGNFEYAPAPSVPQSFTVNAVPPVAPTNIVAMAGDTQASVSFTPPSSSGGAAITGYTVTASPGGLTGMGAGSPTTVTGLTNGQEYTFTVTATNSAGTGAVSAVSNSVIPKAAQTITFGNPGAQNFGTSPTLTATSDSGLTVSFTSTTPDVCTITSTGALTFLKTGVATISANQAGNNEFLPASTVVRSFVVNAVIPGAPKSVVATAGDTQATVSFIPPVFDGGAAITGYTVISNPGGLVGTGTGSPIVVTGLTNGVEYTFSVVATNSIGTGGASPASNLVTPKLSQTITFNNPGAQVFGTNPTLNATSSSGLAVSFTSDTPDVCTVTSEGILTILKPGTAIISVNQPGNSTYLPAATVAQSFTVNAALPGAPTSVVATVGNKQSTVSFTPPLFTGGEAITGYIVTASPGGFTATGVGSPIVITGLTNGTAYTFTVTAKNSAGIGAASAASNSITPVAPPPIPIPTVLPTPSPTPTPKPTQKATETPSATVSPTAVPSLTPAPESSATPTETPVLTPAASATPAPEPTQTPAQEAITRTITGTLIDSSGNPMVGFVVELHSDPMTTVTDENGRYTFNDVAYTNHELIIKTPQGEKVASFELNFSQGKEFSSAKSDKGANITYTQKTETVTLEVTLNPDQSGAVISEVSASSQPQTNGFLSVIGSVLLWVGGGILVIMLLLILANKRKVKE